MKRHITVCLIIILSLVCNFSGKVSGNSGPTSWQGTSGAELLSIDEDTPIEVNEENLVFDFREIVDEGYTISSWITASYEMHNTSEEIENSMMTFPMMSYNSINSEDIQISVDGEKVQYELHPHSIYEDEDRKFSNIVGNIQSDYRNDTIFNGSTDGKIWTFDLLTSSNDYQEITLDLIFDPSKTQLLTDGFNSGHYEYGHVVIGADLKEGDQAFVYFKGEKPVMILSENASIREDDMSFMDYYHTYIIPRINRGNQNVAGENLTNQYNDVSLFNMLAERLQIYVYNQSSIVDIEDLVAILQGEQIVSANYQVAFEPGQIRTVEVSYKVKASMKNKAYGGKEDADYTFEYFLSPASSWLEFGRLNVEVLMDDVLWTLEDSSMILETNELGYRQTFQGLPEGDLFITLTRQQATSPIVKNSDAIELKELVTFFIALGILCCLVYIGLIILKRRGIRKGE